MKELSLFSLLSMLVLLNACSHKNHVHSSGGNQPQDFTADYILNDAQYGTETKMMIKGDQRIMETNALPNHKTGYFPNPGNPNKIKSQNQTYTFPLNPKYTGQAKEVKEPGVALNGVKFDPGTAERVDCSSGEMYRIEAIQDFADLGLDFNNAHVQPTGAYHYHGVSQNLVDVFASETDMVHIGYAKDGHRIMYSKSKAYSPGFILSKEARVGKDCSYTTPRKSSIVQVDGTLPDGTYTSDWIYDENIGNLDQCNGTTIDGEYVYLITEEYPYIGRCLMGDLAY